MDSSDDSNKNFFKNCALRLDWPIQFITSFRKKTIRVNYHEN